jgi:bifunctional non-homologous end joining protein LigD
MAKKRAADAVDEQLARYRAMRHFEVTAEPRGGSAAFSEDTEEGKTRGLPFVIQKHAATRLHYDFRLGWNGVLKSWAVTKGPSYVVADKRLAVQVEDHPMEYGGFEGIIPAGQYGGGSVMVWDQGTWEPQAGHTDVDAGLRDGSLKFVMHGTKMRGKWALIRMGGKAASEKKPNWLLIKEHDAFERDAGSEAVTEAEPNSAVTGRSIEEIAGSKDHVWNSKETAGTGQAWYRQEGRAVGTAGSGTKLGDAEDSGVGKGGRSRSRAMPTSQRRDVGHPDFRRVLTGLPEEKQPAFVKPQLALEAETPPEGAGWLHELKLDGYRMQARKDGTKVQMLTRTGLDWTARMRAIADSVGRLPVEKATLDGEVVVLAENGTTSFAALQAAFQQEERHPLTYFCFDLLYLEGRNTRGLPLVERKELLTKLLEGADAAVLAVSEHLETGGGEMFRHVCALGAEGIVSKRADGTYLSASRGGGWLKLKCLHEQEFVVGGFTLPGKGAAGSQAVGALLLGYYKDGELVYAGRTGTGFTQATHRMLRERLETMRLPATPFVAVPADARKGAIWVKPELVAQVRFATWTADDLVRQAAFLGLREDKPAKEVVREEARPTPKRSGRALGEKREAVSLREIPHPAAKSAARMGHPAVGRMGYPDARSRASSEETGTSASHRVGKTVVAKVAAGEHAAVRLTHPAKVLDAESGMTKQMLADFYWGVAERMLPHIAGRPLSLVRCPEGVGKECFFQKHVTAMLSKEIETVQVPDKKTGKLEPYITLHTREALAGLAQMGVLEVHPWGSRNEDLEHPDRIVIDLDPDEALGWETLTEAANEVRTRLKRLGLESFLKTTGGKGLHVMLPIEPTLDWATGKEFAHRLVLGMEKERPELYLTKMTKSARTGKIYLDYLRNERGATAVAPYSPRARAGGAVSMPLAWVDLKLAERPVFRVAEFAAWKARLKNDQTDPWKALPELRQAISAAVLAAVGIRGRAA